MQIQTVCLNAAISLLTAVRQDNKSCTAEVGQNKFSRKNNNFLTSVPVCEISVDSSSCVMFNRCSKLVSPEFN